jgi:cell division protein FtsW (lipid II flippase)
MLDVFSVILRCICGLIIILFSLRFFYLSAKAQFAHDRSIEENKEIFFKQGVLALCAGVALYAFTKFGSIDDYTNPYYSIMFLLCSILVIYLNVINESLIKELSKE